MNPYFTIRVALAANNDKLSLEELEDLRSTIDEMIESKN